MTRIGRAAQRRRDRQILMASAAIFIAISIIGAVAYSLVKADGPIDQATLCPANGPRGHVLLLIDKTDPLTPIQRQAFEVTLKDVVEKETQEGHLLSVFVVGEDYRQHSNAIFSLCNPGNGDGKSELTANIRQLQRKYQQDFKAPMLKLGDNLVSSQPAKASPIFEMLQLVSINGFRKWDVNGPRKLIIVSDMLHNTAQFSMYRSSVDYEEFSSTGFGKKSQIDLSGVEVKIHYLMNSPQFQTQRNVHFWEQVFEKAGARLTAIRPLEG